MMLVDTLRRAFDSADRLVSIARTKAASAGGAPSLSSVVAGSYDDVERSDISHSQEQLSHNKEWVYACIRLVSQRIAGQQIFVARESKSPTPQVLATKHRADNLEPLDAHPIIDLLDNPSDSHSCWSLICMTVASLELTRRALWWVTEDHSRRLIFPIPVSWIVEVDRKRTVWKIRMPRAAETFPIPGDQAVYFHYPSPADPWGAVSPLQAIAASVEADEAISTAQWKTFRQGQFPGVILTAGRLPTTPGQVGPSDRPILTAEQRKQLVEAIRKSYTGVVRMGEPLILDGLIEKVEKLTLSPQELDFLDSSKVTKSRILQAYGVSPILLGEVEGANRASATIADSILCSNKINPLIELLSQSLTRALAPMFAGQNEKLTVWIQPAVARDPEMHFKKFSLGLARGAVTVNEYRRYILNLADIAGGDELLAPTHSWSPAVQQVVKDLNPYSLQALTPSADRFKSNGHSNSRH